MNNILQQMQSIENQREKPILFIIKENALSLDSISRLNITIKRDCFDDCCPICFDSYGYILFTQSKQCILLNCKHLFCWSDFNLEKFHQKCPICRTQIISGMLIQFKEFDELNNMVLEVSSIQRYDKEHFRSIACSQDGCLNSGIALCNICNSVEKAICENCIENRKWTEYMKSLYQKSVFYCGCAFYVSILSIQENEVDRINTLIAHQVVDSKNYGHLLSKELKQKQIHQNIQLGIQFCYFCPNKTFQQTWELKRHVKDSHKEAFLFVYPESRQCQYCLKYYSTQKKLDNHKCKSLQF